MYAKGTQLPVVTDVNLTGPVGTLADGRPIYSAAVNASTRLDPRFNHINQVQSTGDSTFKSMTLQISKRLKQGLAFNVQYALGKGLDNTPLLTQMTVQSEAGRSDPSNLDRDIGPNPLDIRHNFTGNIVYTSENHSQNPIVRGLLNGNEIGVLLQFNSGLPLNIPANRDLNGRSQTSVAYRCGSRSSRASRNVASGGLASGAISNSLTIRAQAAAGSRPRSAIA